MTYTIAWSWRDRPGNFRAAKFATAKEALAEAGGLQMSDAIIEYVDTPDHGRLDFVAFRRFAVGG